MGKVFLDHIGGTRLFSCAACDINLTNRSELISTRFTGATGKTISLCYLLPFLCAFSTIITIFWAVSSQFLLYLLLWGISELKIVYVISDVLCS